MSSHNNHVPTPNKLIQEFKITKGYKHKKQKKGCQTQKYHKKRAEQKKRRK